MCFAECIKGSKFNNSLDLIFKQYRQNNKINRIGFAQARTDFDITFWNIGKKNPFFFTAH